MGREKNTTLGRKWSFHYDEKKKSDESLEKLTSRTLSPPPESLQRKYSRWLFFIFNLEVSLLFSFRASSTSSTSSGRLPRHPELPPLSIDHNDGPKLKDYLEKPRLVSTAGRRPSMQQDLSVEQLIPGLAQLSMYYNQTLLSTNDLYGFDNNEYKNPDPTLTLSRFQSNR